MPCASGPVPKGRNPRWQPQNPNPPWHWRLGPNPHPLTRDVDSSKGASGPVPRGHNACWQPQNSNPPWHRRLGPNPHHSDPAKRRDSEGNHPCPATRRDKTYPRQCARRAATAETGSRSTVTPAEETGAAAAAVAITADKAKAMRVRESHGDSSETPPSISCSARATSGASKISPRVKTG